MKVKQVMKCITNAEKKHVNKTGNRLATLALGTGLLLAGAGVAKAQELKGDTFKKESAEMTQDDDKSLMGGFMFGGALLLWMGAVALGNKLHDKKQ